MKYLKCLNSPACRKADIIRYLFALLCLLLPLCACCSASGASESAADPVSFSETTPGPSSDPASELASDQSVSSVDSSFSAMIISDLHFTINRDASDVIISGMRHAQEITDVIIDQVIAEGPDVFIMTGDNTNGGGPEDVAALTGKLSRVRDAGIRLVVTTGNHDFNNMTPAEYEKAWFPLIEADDRDPHSLSYTAVIGDTALLAMDDNAVEPGGAGIFSRPTMDWLREMLEKYADKHILFLSHHNVLLGKEAGDSGNYRIQNVDLAGLLQGHGVKLAVTGHFHAQIILEDAGMYEIVSGMPFGGSHLMGRLSIIDRHLTYDAAPIDFESYGAAALADELKRTDERNAGYEKDTFSAAVSESGLPEAKQQQILDLIVRFLAYYTDGTIGEHIDEIRNDPVCDEMIDILWERNYGPWMKSVLDYPPLPATHLELDF